MPNAREWNCRNEEYFLLQAVSALPSLRRGHRLLLIIRSWLRVHQRWEITSRRVRFLFKWSYPLILSQWGLATHRVLHQAVPEVLKEVAVAAAVHRPIHPSRRCPHFLVRLLQRIIVREEREDEMHVDTRSLSPPMTRVSKMLDGASSRSPATKQSQSRSPPVSPHCYSTQTPSPSLVLVVVHFVAPPSVP